MRSEYQILRDIEKVSFALAARWPFDADTELAWLFDSLALLHAELIGRRDFEESVRGSDEERDAERFRFEHSAERD